MTTTHPTWFPSREPNSILYYRINKLKTKILKLLDKASKSRNPQALKKLRKAIKKLQRLNNMLPVNVWKRKII